MMMDIKQKNTKSKQTKSEEEKNRKDDDDHKKKIKCNNQSIGQFD